MDELVRRWKRAGERAAEEQVRILELDGGYVATSSSRPLGWYRLRHAPEGWSCECVANGEHRLPCKHLWALAEALGLDVLADTHVELPVGSEAPPPTRVA